MKVHCHKVMKLKWEKITKMRRVIRLLDVVHALWSLLSLTISLTPSLTIGCFKLSRCLQKNNLALSTYLICPPQTTSQVQINAGNILRGTLRENLRET